MKLLVVSAESAVSKGLLDKVLASPLLAASTRAFFFGNAAFTLAQEVAAVVRAQDDLWIDDAEHFLLQRDSPRPLRAQRDPRFEKLTVVSPEDPSEFAPLEVVEQGIEIAGPRVLMALSDSRRFDQAERTNADLWIVPGGAQLDGGPNHHVLVPPDFTERESVGWLVLGDDQAEWGTGSLSDSPEHLDLKTLPLRTRSRLSSR